MLKEIEGENVTVYLTMSPWGIVETRGEVVEFDDYWLKIKSKKTFEYIRLETIKKITVHAVKK